MTAIIPASFVGGDKGQWQMIRLDAVTGPALPPVSHVAIYPTLLSGSEVPRAGWILRGTNGHMRYVQRHEQQALAAIQEGLGRAEATLAALIPIRKSDAWWNLAQDERRAILEESSHHISTGLKYLPAIARRLYHSRELGEPFDFLTWFEYAPEHSHLFEELTDRLRATEEWRYVEREVDLRFIRS